MPAVGKKDCMRKKGKDKRKNVKRVYVMEALKKGKKQKRHIWNKTIIFKVTVDCGNK